MSQPSFFSDGDTPNNKDTLWRIEQKILGALLDGGGGGGGSGSGSNDLMVDAPADLPATPPDPTKSGFVGFRDGSVGKQWDPLDSIWRVVVVLLALFFGMSILKAATVTTGSLDPSTFVTNQASPHSINLVSSLRTNYWTFDGTTLQPSVTISDLLSLSDFHLRDGVTNVFYIVRPSTTGESTRMAVVSQSGNGAINLNASDVAGDTSIQMASPDSIGVFEVYPDAPSQAQTFVMSGVNSPSQAMVDWRFGNDTNVFTLYGDKRLVIYNSLTTGNPSGGTASPAKIGLNGSVPRLDLNGTGYDLVTGTNFWSLTTTNMRPFQTTNRLQIASTILTNGDTTADGFTINNVTAGGAPFQVNINGTGKFTIAATTGNVTAQAIASGAITASSHIKATGGANVQVLSDTGIFTLGTSADAWIGRAAAARPLVYGSTAAELDIADATWGGITDHRIGRIGFIQNANDLTFSTENLNTFIGTGGRMLFAPLNTNALIIATNGAVTITNAVAAATSLTINASAGQSSDVQTWNVGGVNKFSVSKDGYLQTTAGGSPAIILNDVNTFVTVGSRNAAANYFTAGNYGGSYVFAQLASTGFFGWSNTSDSTGFNPSTRIYRDTDNVIQIGVDAATPTTQALKAADGTGTDKDGAILLIEGGQSTGTGRGGDRSDRTSLTSTTGSSANSYSTRTYESAKFVNLTESTATLFANVALASSKYLGANLVCTVTANDGTDFQSLTSHIQLDAVNKAGTVTATITQVDNTTAASSGTLTCTYTAAANGNSVDIKVNAVSSLTQTVLRAKWILTAVNSDDVATVTPQ